MLISNYNRATVKAARAGLQGLQLNSSFEAKVDDVRLYQITINYQGKKIQASYSGSSSLSQLKSGQLYRFTVIAVSPEQFVLKVMQQDDSSNPDYQDVSLIKRVAVSLHRSIYPLPSDLQRVFSPETGTPQMQEFWKILETLWQHNSTLKTIFREDWFPGFLPFLLFRGNKEKDIQKNLKEFLRRGYIQKKIQKRTGTKNSSDTYFRFEIPSLLLLELSDANNVARSPFFEKSMNQDRLSPETKSLKRTFLDFLYSSLSDLSGVSDKAKSQEKIAAKQSSSENLSKDLSRLFRNYHTHICMSGDNFFLKEDAKCDSLWFSDLGNYWLLEWPSFNIADLQIYIKKERLSLYFWFQSGLDYNEYKNSIAEWCGQHSLWKHNYQIINGESFQADVLPEIFKINTFSGRS